MTQNIYHVGEIFCHSQIFFLKKHILSSFTVFFNVSVLFNIVFNLKLNFKLKINPKMCNFKNLEEIWKPRKYFEKTSGNPYTV